MAFTGCQRRWPPKNSYDALRSLIRRKYPAVNLELLETGRNKRRAKRLWKKTCAGLLPPRIWS